MSRTGSRFWAAIIMGFWIGLLTWTAWWLMRTGWWMMGIDWVFIGLAVALLGLLVMAVCGRGIGLVLKLLAGKTTPRLAKRDFRNSLADLLMFMKTGLWKE